MSHHFPLYVNVVRDIEGRDHNRTITIPSGAYHVIMHSGSTWMLLCTFQSRIVGWAPFHADVRTIAATGKQLDIPGNVFPNFPRTNVRELRRRVYAPLTMATTDSVVLAEVIKWALEEDSATSATVIGKLTPGEALVPINTVNPVHIDECPELWTRSACHARAAVNTPLIIVFHTGNRRERAMADTVISGMVQVRALYLSIRVTSSHHRAAMAHTQISSMGVMNFGAGGEMVRENLLRIPLVAPQHRASLLPIPCACALPHSTPLAPASGVPCLDVPRMRLMDDEQTVVGFRLLPKWVPDEKDALSKWKPHASAPYFSPPPGPWQGLGVTFHWPDWTTHNLPNWTEWFAATEGCPGTICLEVGMMEGRSGLAMMQMVGNKYPTYIGLDIGPMLDDRDSDGRMVILRDNLATDPRMHAVFGPSATSLPRLYDALVETDTQLAICHIDGSHAADDAMLDAEYCFRMLAVGGVMIFDDYLYELVNPADNELAQSTYSPRRGIHAFWMLHGDELELLPQSPNAINTNQIAFKKVRATAQLLGTTGKKLVGGSSGMNWDQKDIRQPPFPVSMITNAIGRYAPSFTQILVSPQKRDDLGRMALTAGLDVTSVAMQGTARAFRAGGDWYAGGQPQSRGFANFLYGLEAAVTAPERAITGFAKWLLKRN